MNALPIHPDSLSSHQCLEEEDCWGLARKTSLSCGGNRSWPGGVVHAGQELCQQLLSQAVAGEVRQKLRRQLLWQASLGRTKQMLHMSACLSATSLQQPVSPHRPASHHFSCMLMTKAGLRKIRVSLVQGQLERWAATTTLAPDNKVAHGDLIHPMSFHLINRVDTGLMLTGSPHRRLRSAFTAYLM